MARPWTGALTCESLLAIDVRQWQRGNRLNPGDAFTHSWHFENQPSCAIAVEVKPYGVLLSFHVTDPGRDQRLIEQWIETVWTPCNLGGGRPWFRCGAVAIADGRGCNRRVAILYCREEIGFACRSCFNLLYESQLESARFRGLGLARKIRMKLGAGPDLTAPFPMKPQRMHLRTYKRLRNRYLIAATRCGAL